MTQEDKELLLKDLCARLPYFLRVNIRGKVRVLDSWADDDGNYFNFLSDGDECNFGEGFTLKEIKPYLRPMSSMTEEEAREIGALHDMKDILSVKVTDEYIDYIVDDGFCSTETRTIWYDEIISSIEIFDWLNKYHFDYRGLFKKGLAIKITKENNPYKE